MNNRITIRTKFHVHAGRNGRKLLETGEFSTSNVTPGRVPWVSKLMAPPAGDIGSRSDHSPPPFADLFGS